MRTLLSLAIIASGCAPFSARSLLLQQELDELEPRLASADHLTRRRAYTDLVGLCCPDSFGGPPFLDACRRLDTTLRTNSELAAIQGVFHPTAVWAPACIDTIPASSVITATNPAWLDSYFSIRRVAVEVIARYEPTAETVGALVRELRRPPGGSGHDVHDEVRRAARELGDEQLAQLAILVVGDSSPVVREAATIALSHAAAQPLEIPGLEGLLIQAQDDPDQDVRVSATVALRLLRSAAALPGVMVAHELIKQDKDLSEHWIRILGRRRFACRLPEVEFALVRAASLPKRPWMVRAARLALENRWRYCGVGSAL